MLTQNIIIYINYIINYTEEIILYIKHVSIEAQISKSCPIFAFLQTFEHKRHKCSRQSKLYVLFDNEYSDIISRISLDRLCIFIKLYIPNIYTLYFIIYYIESIQLNYSQLRVYPRLHIFIWHNEIRPRDGTLIKRGNKIKSREEGTYERMKCLRVYVPVYDVQAGFIL